MQLSQLRAFVALVDCGSMSAAARQLGVSQPSITKAVRTLESEFQVQLVQRTTRGVVPTRFGHALFARAKIAQSELGKVAKELAELAGGHAGFVTFGCGPVVADLLIPEAIVAFQKQYPLAEVRMIEGFAHNLVPRVRDETFDFAVGPRLADFRPAHGVQFRPLFVHDRVVVGRKSHPLAGARSLAKLVHASWLSFEPREMLERSFSDCGLAVPSPIMQCESYIGFLRLLEATDMLGVIPRSTRRLAADPLHVFQLSERLPTLTVGMFTRADSPLTPAAAALAKAVVAAARRIAAQKD
jgi:DNA-binding transcriptional LysR family regulator